MSLTKIGKLSNRVGLQCTLEKVHTFNTFHNCVIEMSQHRRDQQEHFSMPLLSCGSNDFCRADKVLVADWVKTNHVARSAHRAVATLV